MASNEGKPEMQQIDLSKLNIQQLNQLKQQLDQVRGSSRLWIRDKKSRFGTVHGYTLLKVTHELELNFFQDSLQSLKMAQNKLQDSKEVLEKITPESKGSQVMVPLTGSMYVPGTIADSKNVIIDVGTGYYLQKDIDGAKDYFKRKVTFVTEQMEKIQNVGVEKSKIREAVIDVMETKIQAQLSAQKQVAAQ